ncbi:1400_t:CDS:1, partial [Cetraspora pellucida]
MLTAIDRIGPYSTSEYKQEFYIEGALLKCRACHISLNYKKKSVLDDHLNSTRHETAKNFTNNSTQVQQNTDIIVTHLFEREQLNLDLIQALTVVDVPLEKSDKLKEFFKKHYKF